MVNPKYAWRHQKLRAELLPYAPGSLCARCGQTIKAGQPVDLDHAEDGGYLGWSHSTCNRRAGAQKGARMRASRFIPSDAVCAIGVDIAFDRSHTSLVIASEAGSGLTVVELTYLDGSDTAKTVARIAGRRRKCVATVIDPRSPATTLIAPLQALNITITEPNTKDVALAHGLALDELKAGRLKVVEHEALTAAVAHATARPLAGGEALERRRVSVDASPLTALELATWALLRNPAPPEPSFTDLDDYLDDDNGINWQPVT